MQSRAIRQVFQSGEVTLGCMCCASYCPSLPFLLTQYDVQLRYSLDANLTFWSWKIPFNFQSHQSICDYALIPCRAGCGQEVMRKELAEHFQHECVSVTLHSSCRQKVSDPKRQVWWMIWVFFQTGGREKSEFFVMWTRMQSEMIPFNSLKFLSSWEILCVFSHYRFTGVKAAGDLQWESIDYASLRIMQPLLLGAMHKVCDLCPSWILHELLLEHLGDW